MSSQPIPPPNLSPQSDDWGDSAVSSFLSVYFIFWFFLLGILWRYGYNNSFLMLNALHTPVLDLIMPHYTHIGDGVLMGTLFGLFFIKKDRALVLSLIVSLILMAIVINLLKKQVFGAWDRPLAVFNAEDFHYVATRVLKRNAFPSGHSASAGLLFVWLSFATRSYTQILGGLFAILSIIACFSRVYIGVHFPGDIVAGSFIGIVIGLLVLFFLYPVLKRWIDEPETATQKHKNWEIGLYIFTSLLLIGDIYFLVTTHYL